MSRLLDHWALVLLLAMSLLLVALICETSWPVAYVYLMSVPGGAEVSDGEGFFWCTPAWIPVSHEGLHLTLSRAGRLSVDTVITPGMADSPVVVDLPYLFMLTVTTDPAGASVLLDGLPAGSTPVTLEIPEPGSHIVSITEGYVTLVSDSILLLDNSPDTLHYRLPRPYGEGMVLVPSGPCSPSGLDHSFLISRTEVTNTDFCRYLSWLEPSPEMDSTNRWARPEILESIFPGDYPVPFIIGPDGMWAVEEGLQDHPVAGLTARTARDYCEWYSTLAGDGLEYRLPAPSEWRTAALAGGGGPWPWGSRRPDGSLLNLSDCNEVLLRRHPSIDDGHVRTSPVGSYPPNGWGLFDMAGNLWEYCIPAGGGVPVAMGGSWLSSIDDCRCDSRMNPDTSLGYAYVGFRLAATLEQGR